MPGEAWVEIAGVRLKGSLTFNRLSSSTLLFDPQGSCVASSNGTVSAAGYYVPANYAPTFYDAYGSLVWTPTATTSGTLNNTTAQPFQYKGQFGYYSDGTSGLAYCIQRYYDPLTGRWTNRDPTGLDGGVNVYAYCEGDPVAGADPVGLVPDWDYFVGERYAKKWGGWPKTYLYESYTGELRWHLADQGNFRPMDHWSNRDLYTVPVIVGGIKRRPIGVLIEEWEAMSGEKWPKDPATGRPYIGDHIVPLADGGEDHGRNLQPQKSKEAHLERHSKNGDFTRWAKERWARTKRWGREIEEAADSEQGHG